MHRRWDQAQHKLPLGDDRISNNRTEDPVVFPQINDHIKGFVKRSFHEYRRHAAIGISDIQALFPKTVLQRSDHVPEMVFKLMMLPPQLKTLMQPTDHGPGKLLRKRFNAN